ncbi:MAG: IS66 family insertion sequence element accessory protein TnpB [Clostridiales bacterium]|nr:IS66 family insertion sequence element accessory protein TnpB [Clostridiales bacterium]
MNKTTHEVRLAHWKQIIEQCQSRPEEQTTKQWLAENGISNKSYYYWLRKIRKQAYEQSSGNSLPSGQAKFPAVQAQSPVSFVEIPFASISGSAGECTFHPAAVIKVGNASIAFTNDASAKLMSGIIREVTRHA